MLHWYCNLPSHAQNVDTVKLKRCPLIIASFTTNARVVVCYYTLMQATAVFTVHLVQCHAHQYKKRVRKVVVQHPVVSLNDREWQKSKLVQLNYPIITLVLERTLLGGGICSADLLP